MSVKICEIWDTVPGSGLGIPPGGGGGTRSEKWWGCAAGRWKLDPKRSREKWNLGPKRSNSVRIGSFNTTKDRFGVGGWEKIPQKDRARSCQSEKRGSKPRHICITHHIGSPDLQGGTDLKRGSALTWLTWPTFVFTYLNLKDSIAPNTFISLEARSHVQHRYRGHPCSQSSHRPMWLLRNSYCPEWPS